MAHADGCPFCGIAEREAAAVVYDDGRALGVIGLHQKDGAEGVVLVMPLAHHATLYELPAEAASHLMVVAQRLAIGVKRAFQADGVTLLQNNEAAGDQDVGHVHLHVIPRYVGDQYHQRRGRVRTLEDRSALAARVREALAGA